jgi:hypothetical protein
MGHKCAAYGCKSGYSSDGRKDISFHKFPQNEELQKKWIKANPRKDFVVTKHSRLCSLHFTESDFITERTDSNSRRRRKHATTQLTRRYLSECAVPTIFPNAPSYLSSEPTTSRASASSATSSGRQRQEAERLETLIEQFELQDKITSLSLAEVAARLLSESAVPPGFQVVVIDGLLLIYRVQLDNCIPDITASITVKPDFSLTCAVNKKLIPASQLCDLTTDGSVETLSQLQNIMARVNAWCDASTKPEQLMFESLLQCLEELLATLEVDSDEHRRFTFIQEQLKLARKNKHSRHYSPQLIIFSYLLHAASPAAYNTLLDNEVLCLPTVKTLNKITKHLNSNSGLDNLSYLKLRVSKLNEFERTVVLIIDEIYVAKRVEYSNGEVQGLTSDGAVASTLLCFMVKSLVNKFKDVVAIYPMATLTAAKQHDCYTEVLTMLNTVGLYVVAISVDNATTNRKFFADCLCDGTLKTSIMNNETGQPIFLIFDPVHDLKNVYNNFQSRKMFECPTLIDGLPAGCKADFRHVVQLYDHEASAALKKAHKLSPAVLQPKSIEKTSVKLATAVFSESTRDALQYYATHCSDKAAWAGTADFIAVILKLWNVMNVKTSSKGKHKRDATQDPVRSSLDWKLQYLRQFADFLERWEASRKGGLTKETFLALRHSCLALADCASFLLDRRGFNYVCLGHLQFDAIECRFGWLRQLSGANYFISARQVFESDRKIRAVSLLKFSGIFLAEIEDAIHVDSSLATDTEADVIANDISASLKLNLEPSDSDKSIIFYVGGYIVRSTVACTKCDHCREALIGASSTSLPTINETDVNAAEFLDQINRGGLVRPSDFVYSLVVHCWRVFDEIWRNAELKAKFLKASGQRNVFEKIMDRATDNETFIDLLFGQNMCSAGHNLQKFIVRRFFNCVAKNFVKCITALANPHHEPVAKKRKIAKLTSTRQ